MHQWPSAEAYHQKINRPSPLNRPLPFALLFPPAASPYQLLRRLNWSYFALWSLVSGSSSSRTSPRAQLIWKTGDYNKVSVAANDPKLRYIAFRMQQFQSMRQQVMADRIAEKSMATMSYQWATGSDISGTLFKDAPIQNVLCIPLMDKTGVLELGTTDLVPDPSVLLAEIQRYLIGDEQTTTPQSPTSSHYSPRTHAGQAHVPHMAPNNTLASIESSRMIAELENTAVLKEMLDKNTVVGTMPELSVPTMPPCSFDHIDSLYIEAEPQNFATYSHGGHHYNHPLDTFEGVRGALPNLSHASYAYRNIVSDDVNQNHDLSLLNYETRSSTSTSPSLAQLNVALEGQDTLNSTMHPQNEVISTLQQPPCSVNPIRNYMDGAPYVGSDSSIPNANPNEQSPATQHMIAERKRRKKQKDMFNTLKTIVPSINKRDKVTILDNTINYLKELQGRVDDYEQQIKHFNSKTKPNINTYSCSELSDQVPLQPNCSVVYHDNSSSTLKLSIKKMKGTNDTINNIIIRIMESLTKLRLYCVNIDSKKSQGDTLDLTLLATYKDEQDHVELAEVEKHWRHLCATF